MHGMRGIYQHCREKHLHGHLAEYDFRYNHRVALGFDGLARTTAMVKGATGKRLTYRQADWARAPLRAGAIPAPSQEGPEGEDLAAFSAFWFALGRVRGISFIRNGGVLAAARISASKRRWASSCV